ncbi:DUF3606 domain-containing protein [Polaromonas sp.]|uniref:DUF3606 domain-containing protein n=1 Tax=Polaromonas sp. TaxID=1869339 RepID=UPI0032636FD4
MTPMTPTSERPGIEPDRINLNHKDNTEQWMKKLNVTHDQLRDAVAAVGDLATNVEMHLKGARSTTNADRTRELETGEQPPR